jgi:16S rRNA (uracil1498-N3)-methyltransferase
MAISRVYVNEDLSYLKPKQEVALSKDAYHHIIRVCRYKLDDKIYLFDNTNLDQQFLVKIINAAKNKLEVEVLELEGTKTQNTKSAINLYISLARGNTFEWILQKSVELGVSSITPILTDLTQYKINLSDKAKLADKMDHWRKVMIRACEQCGLNIVPDLNSVVKFKDIFTKSSENFAKSSLNLIATGPLESEKVESLAKNKDLDNFLTIDKANKLFGFNKGKMVGAINILVGPEGGFSTDEVSMSCKNNFKSMCCGPRVLRMETAPIVFITLCQAFFGDF